MSFNHQDWKEVVFKKKYTKEESKQKAIKEGNIKSVRKFKGSDEAHKKRKLDEETETFKHEKVNLSVGKAIQKARMEKKLTQKELAMKLMVKTNVITDYENGKAIPDNKLLSKMQRLLGVKLIGKNIGEKFGKK